MEIHPGEPKCTTFYARYFFECLQIACTKTFTAELMDVSRLWNLNKKKVEEFLYRDQWPRMVMVTAVRTTKATINFVCMLIW